MVTEAMLDEIARELRERIREMQKPPSPERTDNVASFEAAQKRRMERQEASGNVVFVGPRAAPAR